RMGMGHQSAWKLPLEADEFVDAAVLRQAGVGVALRVDANPVHLAARGCPSDALSRATPPQAGEEPWTRSGALREVPVEDLLAGPEQDARLLPDMRERGAEIFEAVRRAHDVGVRDERHHARGVPRIGVELVELVAGAVAV